MTAIRWAALCAAVLGIASARPAAALPKFAREYGVTCQACHSIPPRLNRFGLAFQANYFNWPGGKAKKDLAKAFPVSGLAIAGLEDNRTTDKTTASFRDLYLHVSDGFKLRGNGTGGFFLKTLAAATGEEKEGELEQAYLALPLAARGKLSVVAGQFTPLMYQWDPVNRLSASSPSAVQNAVSLRKEDEAAGKGGGGPYPYPYPLRRTVRGLDASEAGGGLAFGFTRPIPGVRLDFFDHRSSGTADGNYVSLGVPFGGELAFNDQAALHGARGGFLHAFRRWGYSSLGVLAYKEAGNHLEGLVGTHELTKNLYLLGIGAIGHDAEGSTRRLSLETEYVLSRRLALTGRLDLLGGAHDDAGEVLAVTFYPFKLPVLRLTGEITQEKGSRSVVLFARGQF